METQAASTHHGLWLSLKVFVGHYRRAPLQAGAILLGIILSVVLLTAVKSINENARASYREATAPLSGRAAFSLLPAGGAAFLSDDIYFSLSRQGLKLIPRLNGVITDDSGRRFYIDGIDIIAATSAARVAASGADTHTASAAPVSPLSSELDLASLLTGEPVLLLSQSHLEKIQARGGITINGEAITLIGLDDSYGLGSTLVADLSFAKDALQAYHDLSTIEVLDNLSLAALQQHLHNAGIDASRIEIVAEDNGAALTELTGSFHLSLKAMGLLAFVVGLFIAYNGVRYSLMKRTRLLLQLRQLGVGQRELLGALTLELMLMVSLGAAAGFILGLWLGQVLMPLVAMTLEQIYGARLLPGHWQPGWFIEAFGLTAAASLFACIPLMARLVATPLASSRHQAASQGFDTRMQRLQLKVAAALLLLALAITLMEPEVSRYLREQQLPRLLPMYSLGLIALVTLSAPLLLPSLLARLPALLTGFGLFRPGLSHYLVAELKVLAPPMSLAMMAMLLALSANIAMTTLVGSFEGTLKVWLNQRLHADIYVRPGDSRMQEVMTRLEGDRRISASYRQYSSPAVLTGPGNSETRFRLLARDSISVRETSTLKTFDSALWQAMQQGGNHILVNEPMALRLNIQLGDTLDVAVGGQRLNLMVAGIFYDHGNQQFETIIEEDLWLGLGLSPIPMSLALSCGKCDAELLANDLASELELSRSLIFSQQNIKKIAITMFGRTFEITASLGTLTLLVASIGLFSALSMLSASRENTLARLHALGVSRRELLFMSAAQMLLMVLATALLAVPVAWILAWLLIHKVILLSFGWSLTMDWQWLPVLTAIGAALLSASLALAWPLWRQSRRPLIRSLQQEAN
ncbi:ABC transporter permease [Shewanella litorisediminis]|uniref:FtsX-like permease family protein n=1 Tax=Shewanella litorisediminis TaxID=1173586 RepID=A0ABX7G1N2_9GAMM|nr:ABC transporter permease [Shewanella litorisediminis]MCL2920007.1 FtsX-like permease family protein [Shewanella litorisediminis]QRH01191.1 FtsX-like permease family protein [Shewanella litorisediminis]